MNWNSPYAMSAGGIAFAAVGVNSSSTASNVVRKVTVSTVPDPLFKIALAARNTIDMNGNNVMTDSFDSGDPNHSDWNATLNYGLYPASISKTKANGNIATDANLVNSVSVGNANIKGMLETGPFGTATIGPNGTVGDRPWVEGGSLGIQPGHLSNDFNVVFPDVVLPNISFLPASPNSTNIGGVTYQYAFMNGGSYVVYGAVAGSIFVNTNAQVNLRITGSFKLTGGNSIIRIAQGGSLNVYMTGDTFSVAGLGIVNETGLAQNFVYYGTPQNTAINFGGNAGFTGCIYAPSAFFTLGGGGSDALDFIGAAIVSSAKFNGSFNFHYDEGLRNKGPMRGYIPIAWVEK
jgi:hypothetical protein